MKTQVFPLLQELVNHVGQYEQRQVEGLGAGAGVVAEEAVTEAHLAGSNDGLGLHAPVLVGLVGAPTLRVAHAQYAHSHGVAGGAGAEHPAAGVLLVRDVTVA